MIFGLQPFAAARSDLPVKITEYLPDAASVLYYPAGFHTEMALGDKVYNPADDYKYRGSLSDAIERTKSGGKGFVRFGFALTTEEKARLTAFMSSHEGRPCYDTCVGATSQMFRTTTVLPIPFPFNLHPTANALYFSALYATGLSRVTRVEIHGPLSPAFEDLSVGGSAALVLATEAIKWLDPASESFNAIQATEWFAMMCLACSTLMLSIHTQSKS